MGKKNFCNFGDTRATVTPRKTITALVYAGNAGTSSVLSGVVLLAGNSTSSAGEMLRKDKKALLRLRQYVEDFIVQPDAVSYFASTGVKALYRQKRIDATSFFTKWKMKVTSGNVPTNTEAWYNYVGSVYAGMPTTPLPPSNMDLASPSSGESYVSFLNKLWARSQSLGVTGDSFPPPSAVGGEHYFFEGASYTPFCIQGTHIINYASSMTLDLLFQAGLLVDPISGCTVSQKLSVSDLIKKFREGMYASLFELVANAENKEFLMQWVADMKALPEGGVLNYSWQDYTGDIPNEYSRLFVHFPTMGGVLGSFMHGLRTGLIPFESSVWSGVTNYDTIERIMSGKTCSQPYTTVENRVSILGNTSNTFSVQGRAGALRSMRLVTPDNLNRCLFDLKVEGATPPTDWYAGLVSIRPLGKFTDLNAADGYASEVRLKENQLSLFAFGAGRFLDSPACLPRTNVSVSSSSSSVYCVGGLPTHTGALVAFKTLLRDKTITLDGVACKYFATVEVMGYSSSAYSIERANNIDSYGTIDPDVGTASFAVPMQDITHAEMGVTLRCVVPYEVDGMKVQPDGSVPYFTLAEGSDKALSGDWGWKAGVAYLQGSYIVFTRIQRYTDLTTAYGNLSLRELMEKAGDAFLTECQGYFTTGDVDPNPVEQYMQYTPLKNVGYDLPDVLHYQDKDFDFLSKATGVVKGAPSPWYKKAGANKLYGSLRSSKGSRLDSLYNLWFGQKLSTVSAHVNNLITSQDLYVLPLFTGVQEPYIDGGVGYYGGRNKTDHRARMKAIKFNPVRSSEKSDIAEYNKSGRFGFRATSLNSGVLLGRYFTSLQTMATTPLFITTPNALAGVNAQSHESYAWALHRASPEQMNKLDELNISGTPVLPKTKAYSLLLPVAGSNLYSAYTAGEGSQYNFLTNATRTLSGVACRDDVPTQFLPVKLFDRETGTLLATQLSGKNGLYKFRGLQNHKTYMVVVSDPKKEFNSDIEDLEVKTT